MVGPRVTSSHRRYACCGRCARAWKHVNVDAPLRLAPWAPGERLDLRVSEEAAVIYTDEINVLYKHPRGALEGGVGLDLGPMAVAQLQMVAKMPK